MALDTYIDIHLFISIQEYYFIEDRVKKFFTFFFLSKEFLNSIGIYCNWRHGTTIRPHGTTAESRLILNFIYIRKGV